MSATLAYGNIFHIVAEYERYVDYRVIDPTLNGWNYEPIFAARWVEPTEIAPAPRHLFVPLRLPTDFRADTIIFTPGPESTKLTMPVEPSVEFADVPEPGYCLLVALVLTAICIRLRRAGRPSEG